MPKKPMRLCSKLGCNNLTTERYCEQHKHHYDIYRRTAADRGYNARWRKARKSYLMRHPQCVACGHVAEVVDHIVPHKGNQQLFWDTTNWQSLCHRCHNAKTAREDMGTW
jgi:5-methylcytosine-specific restriction protein A